MSIQIHVKKHQAADPHNNLIEVVGLKALSEDQLPKEYLNQPYNVFYEKRATCHGSINILACRTPRMGRPEAFAIIIRVGTIYKPEEFENRMKFIRKCGKKLQKINRQIKASKSKKTIISKKTYVI